MCGGLGRVEDEGVLAEPFPAWTGLKLASLSFRGTQGGGACRTLPGLDGIETASMRPGANPARRLQNPSRLGRD